RAEHGDGEAAPLGGRTDALDVSPEPLLGNAPVFHHLERASRLGEAGEDGARELANRPQPLEARAVQRRLHVRRYGLEEIGRASCRGRGGMEGVQWGADTRQ